MASQILAIIGSILAIIIGLWKWFFGNRARKEKLREQALNEVKEAIKAHDRSRITSAYDRLNRVR